MNYSVRRGDLLAEVGRLDDRWLLAQHISTQNIAFFDLTRTSLLVSFTICAEYLAVFPVSITIWSVSEELNFHD